jgi:hypothetical protein
MADGHLGVLASKIRCPSSKPTTLQSRATGNANAAIVAALAARTSGRAGMAVEVDRIIPVEYSEVTVFTASAPSATAAIMTPAIEALAGSKTWRCWAVMVCH